MVNSKFILAILLTINSSAISQTYSSVISDNQIIDFLNWQVNTDKNYPEEPKHKRKIISTEIIKWDTSHFRYDTSKSANSYEYVYVYLFNGDNKWLDSIFSSRDKDFFINQSMSQRGLLWHHKLAKAKLTDVSKFKQNYYRLYSLPLFSVDKTYVVIQISYYCGGECGYRSVNIYKRNKGGWILIDNVHKSIS